MGRVRRPPGIYERAEGWMGHLGVVALLMQQHLQDLAACPLRMHNVMPLEDSTLYGVLLVLTTCVIWRRCPHAGVNWCVGSAWELLGP